MTPNPALEHLQRLLSAQRWREARPLLERLLEERPGERALIHPLCEAEILDGAAARALERLEALPPSDDPDTAFLHARALAALGRDAAAREELRALRTRLPQGSASVELHLAAVEERLGDRQSALGCARSAVALAPRMAAAHSALAALLAADGQAEESCEALARAAAAAPGDVTLRIGLARAQASLSRPQAALASLREAVAAGPPDAASWHAIGQLFAEHFDWHAAAEALAQALRMDPGQPQLEALAAVVSRELGDMEGASKALARAAARDPGNLNVAVARCLMLPPVYEDAADLARRRERYARGMDELLEEEPRFRSRASEVFELNHTNFFLAYQGQDDRDLQRAYSGFVSRLAESAWPEAFAGPAASFDGARRLRVGFASTFFYDCTIGRYFERWITGLDAKRFERCVYHSGAISDEFTRRIARRCERFALLRSGAVEAAKRLRADALDVLIYPEVGMDPLGYILAALRLAPVQLAAWGHPVTTGSGAIDRFVTVGTMEPPDGAEHYVEPLLRLPGPGVSYAMPDAAAPMARADLGLPADARIYACPQSLFKIHPDNDALYAGIAAADPQAILAFFQAQAPAITARFAERVQRALAARGVPARGQVRMLPRMGAMQFRAFLAASDVVLDTLHWSGGNTSFDAFAAGTPVVTLPGRFMRGRQTAAMLEAMGLSGLVAADAADYAKLALQVARDRDANAGLRERIAAERGAIFEREEPVRALGEALQDLAARAS